MKVSPALTLIGLLGIASVSTALYWARNSPKELLDLSAPVPAQSVTPEVPVAAPGPRQVDEDGSVAELDDPNDKKPGEDAEEALPVIGNP